MTTKKARVTIGTRWPKRNRHDRAHEDRRRIMQAVWDAANANIFAAEWAPLPHRLRGYEPHSRAWERRQVGRARAKRLRDLQVLQRRSRVVGTGTRRVRLRVVPGPRANRHNYWVESAWQARFYTQDGAEW